MPSLGALELAIFILACFGGALIAGIAGFAFGLIASAIWLHAISPSQSAVLIAAFAILIQGATLWKLRKAVQFSRLLPFLVGGAIGIPIGALILRWSTPLQMRGLVGCVLVLFSLFNLLRPKFPAVPGGRLADGVAGLAGGFLGGGTGLAGIPIIVWSTLRRWPKDEQRAVFQPVAVAILLMTLAWFGGAGAITLETVRLFLVGLPFVLLGTWIGFKLYGRLDEARFRMIVLCLLLLSGLTLLVPWF
jgi:uncharacterized membrane protein YfcA